MIENIATNAINFFHIQTIFNSFIAILIIMWAYKRLKEGDFLQLKTFMSLLIFIVYVGFINWTIKEPSTFIEYFHAVIFYPANWLMDLISNSISHIMLIPKSGTETSSISFLIQSAYNAIYLIYNRIFDDLSIITFYKLLPQLFLFALVIIAEIAFMALVLLIVAIVTIETYIWLAFGVLFPPLVLFPQTRSIAFTYIKKIISLTLYQPALFLFAFFNFAMIFAVVKKIPSKEEMNQGFFGKTTNVLNSTLDGAGYVTIMGYFTMIIIGAFVCFYLVKRTPDFINNLFGTSGGIGGTAEMIQKMATTLTAMTLGGIVGYASGTASNAYQQAGGGVGGLIAGTGSLVTGGLGKSVAGELGKKINESKIGSKINEGISFGTDALKGGKK